eukprot:1316453-Prymnesium_polylepis.1
MPNPTRAPRGLCGPAVARRPRTPARPPAGQRFQCSQRHGRIARTGVASNTRIICTVSHTM